MGPSAGRTFNEGDPGDWLTRPAVAREWIRKLRGPKPEYDPWIPQGVEVEDERDRHGEIVSSGTAFLTNRECPFTCLMCDLWQYTTDDSVPVGAVDRQVEIALERMPGIRQIKLYNAGNFFDDRAISVTDRERIAPRLSGLDRVVVENHPRMSDERLPTFRDATGTELEVAMGLETAHPEVLPKLNKGMSLDDFAAAARRLTSWGIHLRAFILLRPPFLGEDEGVEWALRSIEFAHSVGVECCSVIPTRGGNGALDALAAEGSDFAPPTLRSLEAATEAGIRLGGGRVFADLWDIDRIADCAECASARITRLRTMNRTQALPPTVECTC